MYVSGVEQGGVIGIGRLADRQIGPTCALEATENQLQLYYNLDNDFSETTLRPLASQAGFMIPWYDGDRLATTGITYLLSCYGVAATWLPFNHRRLLDGLNENRTAILIVDAHVLYPAHFFPGSLHAILVTNYIVDVDGNSLFAYVGLDSNFERQERIWHWQVLERAVVQSGDLQMLLTDDPVHWSEYTKHYQLLRCRRRVLTDSGVKVLTRRNQIPRFAQRR